MSRTTLMISDQSVKTIQSEDEVKRPLPSSLYGRPVEEVDPFVFEDTFCVIAKKYCHHYVHRFSATRSLFIFGPLNPMRELACRIITNQIFDIFIIIIILGNCITLALVRNEEVEATGTFKEDPQEKFIIFLLECTFLGLYTVELILKVVAKGFIINRFSYLRNPWNVLDFIVVTSGYVVAFTSWRDKGSGSDDGLEILRAIRVLRAIKTISIIPGLRTMINSLISSAKQLVEVLALMVFVLMIFSLLATQLYMGKLLQKCVLVKGGSAHADLDEMEAGDLSPINPGDPDASKQWYRWVTDSKNWFKRVDAYPLNEYQPCGNKTVVGDGRLCLEGYVCLGNIGENYDAGWTNFDNFGYSMLSTFQLITLDFWERLYDLILSTNSPLSVFFILIVIFLSSYYLLNLLLAVVSMSYEEEYHLATTQDTLTKQQVLSLHRTKSTFIFDDPVKLQVAAMTHYRKRTPSEREMIARTLKNMSISRQEEEFPDGMKRKVNLHEAILTLLGRRRSMELGGDDDTRTIANKSVTINDKVTVIDNIAPQNVPVVSTDISPPKTRSKAILVINPKATASITTITNTDKQSSQPSIPKFPENRCLRGIAHVKFVLTPVVNNKVFETIIMVCIIVNTLLLASEHHDQPAWHDNLLKFANHIFTGIFVFEATIKIFALQTDYFKSCWNVFDLIVSLISIVDSVIERYNLKFSIIRTFRLLRVFKLAQSWITMKVLLRIIFSTLVELGYLTMVLVILLYIFAVLGLQVIGRYYTKKAFSATDDEELYPRWHFNNFWYAFMMVFRVICGEWIEPLWDCLQATAVKNDEYKCFLIFIPILVIGNFIILNLFLALLLNSFDTEELNAQREKELEASGKRENNLTKIVGMLMRSKVTVKEEDSDLTVRDTKGGSGDAGDAAYMKKKSIRKGRIRFQNAAKKMIMMNRKAVAERMIAKANLKLKQSSASKTKSRHGIMARRDSSFVLGRQESQPTTETTPRIPTNCVPKKCWSLNCKCFNCIRSLNWNKWDSSRAFANRIVSHPIFEWLILSLIFASSITLCFEDIYLDEKPKLKDALFYINSAFTTVFILEMLLKWFALGFWNYFTTSWTLLDFFIVMISMTSWVFEWKNRHGNSTGKKSKQWNAFKALRTFRALRPLRAISRWQGMKIVVNALMFAIPSIMNVLLVCLLFWLIFSIVGVQFFKGKFFKCVKDNGDIVPKNAVQGGKQECCANTNKWSWINTYPNFDNVFQGYLTLFQVATFEGWMEAMKAAVDATDVDKQPERDYRLESYTFFVVFIIFGSFFTLNLFIGVIIDNFNRLKKKYEGNLLEVLLTPSQRHYYTAMKKLGRKKPRKVIQRPKNKFLSLFYDVSMSRRFEIMIFVTIFCNLVILAFEYHNQRLVYTHILSGFNSFFITIYAIEAIVKIVGLRQYYFTIPWNIFDFALVVLSIIDLAIAQMLGNEFPFPPQMLRMVRIFRIGRILRLIKAAKGIRKLLFALIVSLPALFNIAALLALITFIYAILGMALFANIPKNNAIDDVFNFDTFLKSCLLLLRIMTAAGWNDVLIAMYPIKPECGAYRNIDCTKMDRECASVPLAIIYMVSYLMVSYLIVINMYSAIIMENFVEASKEDEVGIVEDDLEMFYLRWSRYDPQATQFINFDNLSDFLASLDPPLGIPKPNIVAIVAFNLPIARGNKIHCLDILHSLIKHVLGHIDDSQEFRKLQEQMEHKFRKQFPTRKLLDIISSTRVWKMQHNAAIVIQRAWRAYRAQKRTERGKSGQSIGGDESTSKDHRTTANKMGNLLHLTHKGRRHFSGGSDS